MEILNFYSKVKTCVFEEHYYQQSNKQTLQGTFSIELCISLLRVSRSHFWVEK